MSENFVYDVMALISVHDVVALNNYMIARIYFSVVLVVLLSACGAVYKANPIYKKDNNALEWTECSSLVLCFEDFKNYYINPYTYNPSAVNRENGELIKGSSSLYEIASTVYSPPNYEINDITDFKKFTIALRKHETSASQKIFENYSSSMTSARVQHPLKAFKEGDELPQGFENSLIGFLNRQLPRFDLYSSSGFTNTPRMAQSTRLKNLARVQHNFKEDSLIQFNKLVLEEIFPGVFKKTSHSSFEEARLARNLLQQAILRVSDKAVAKHLASVLGTQVNTNLVLGLTAVGLTSYAVVASEAAAQVATAAATGTIAARALVNEQVYRDALTDTIIGSINSKRYNYIVNELTPKFDQDVLTYNVEQAISDAERYHEMGSFYYGLQQIKQDANDASKQRMNARQ